MGLLTVFVAIFTFVRNQGEIPCEECVIRKEVIIPLIKNEKTTQDAPQKELSNRIKLEASGLIEQEDENKRLVLQRDTMFALKKVFKKPINYKGSFSCLLSFEKSKKKLSIKKCNADNLARRSVELAIERGNILPDFVNGGITQEKYNVSIEF